MTDSGQLAVPRRLVQIQASAAARVGPVLWFRRASRRRRDQPGRSKRWQQVWCLRVERGADDVVESCDKMRRDASARVCEDTSVNSDH